MAKFILVFFIFLNFVNCGKVLFFMPMIPKSSKITWYPLALKLADRGHEVTIVSPYASEKAYRNVKEIIVKSNFDEYTKNLSADILTGNITKWEIFTRMLSFSTLAREVANSSLSHLIQHEKFFEENTTFDITIAMAVGFSETSYYVAWKFNSTLALYFAQQMALSTQSWALGQPHNPAYIPMIGMEFTHPMNFWQRCINLVMTVSLTLMRDYFTVPHLEDILDYHFPEDKGRRPPLLQLEKEAGLAFQFGHPLIMDGARPVSPNYVMIGMMNCRPAQKLPSHLEKFMANSEDGVILVSFGTVLQASLMSDDLRLKLTSVFGQLKQRILWKWESEEMENKPDNVMLSKWLPQQDILAHPKLRLFITHGGQSSSQEALCHKKPVVVLSVFGDQPSNAIEAERRGYGLHIPLSDLTSENLLEAIKRILNEPIFTLRAKEHGQMVMDQMTTPFERAIWWIEYAIRYPKMRHMRSPVHDLHWTQLFLLDVIAFLLACLILTFVGFYLAFKFCCCRKSKQKKE